jgi:pimeloyl-ACP methyl ester carboxylesterase
MPSAAGLYYFAHEADDHSRPPVILIHGAGGDHLYWPPQIRRLPGQRVFAPDLPGHGKSEGLGHHAVAEYARYISEFISELKFYKAALVGHSMGSAIALSIAIQAPGRVAALGLIGSSAKPRVSPAILNGASNPSGIESTVQMIIASSFALKTSARLKQLAEERMSKTRPAVLHGDFLACESFDATAQLSELSIPTLIVCGSEDRMTPLRHSEFLRDHIQGARLAVVPNAGHMVMLEQPAAVADLLSDFLHTLS